MIKWFTIILLLLNVSYFAWHMNQQISHAAAPTTTKQRPQLASSTSLVLLSELEELPALRKAGLEAEQGPTDQTTEEKVPQVFDAKFACYSIGPYPTKLAYQDLKGTLVEKELPYHERFVETRTRERYWVYLKPQASVAAAQKRLQELKKQGLQDYYLISKGDMKNAISLGLFSSQDAVNRRLAELKKKGYYPVVVPQHKINTVYWLDVQLREDLQLSSLPKGVEISDINCQEIALRDLDQ